MATLYLTITFNGGSVNSILKTNLTKKIHRMARNMALSNGERYHVACILYRQKKAIFIGTNSKKTHPICQRVTKDGSCVACLHAEMSALRFAQAGDSIEVLRFLKCGSVTMARPCQHCASLIVQKKLKQVRYTNWEGAWEIADPTDFIKE